MKQLILPLLVAIVVSGCGQGESQLDSNAAQPYGSKYAESCRAVKRLAGHFPSVRDVDSFVNNYGRQAYSKLDSANKLVVAKSDLLNKVSGIEPWAKTSSPESAARWEKLLSWNEIRTIVEAGSEGDITRLKEIEDEHNLGTLVSLDLKKLNELRASLTSYINALAFDMDPLQEEQYQKVMDEVQANLAAALNGNTEASQKLGVQVQWLKSSGQALVLAEAVRCYFSYSNMQTTFSERLMTAKMRKAMIQSEGVRDRMFGASIRGVSTSRAVVDVNIVPSASDAKFYITLRGTATSSTTSRSQPVTVRSRGNGSFNAQKEVRLGEVGVTHFYATGTATNRTNITNINPHRIIGKRIIRRKVRQRAGAGNSRARNRIRTKAIQQLESRSAEPLAKMNKEYKEKFVSRLKSRDMYPERLNYASDDRNIYMYMFQAGEGQLGPVTSAPNPYSEGDVTTRIHESAFNNMLEQRFGGDELTDEDVETLIADITGDIPDDLAVDPTESQWSTHFTEKMPISVSFDGHEMTYVVRGESFTVDDETVAGSYVLTAKGRFVKINGVYQKELIPEATAVVFTSGEEVDEESTDLLKRKLAAIMGTEIFRTAIDLDKGFVTKGKLHLEFVDTSKGWLNLGWRFIAN